ncbi:FliM/FliN family flagellar motor switch protein [Roseiconus lacunae]|uniref:FliM/FliN family flagellar motor switch protein n=1 Tax=Roseiconus lacunae TaxID=2605694 RepID=UPI001E2FDEE0|nr:FliM/FliN family flagellar motor switch protein [Roseiconus lacunae]MCD0457856.1 FliM/FliN family flagellar motor switch protein [Roseiconus lacunae]
MSIQSRSESESAMDDGVVQDSGEPKCPALDSPKQYDQGLTDPDDPQTSCNSDELEINQRIVNEIDVPITFDLGRKSLSLMTLKGLSNGYLIELDTAIDCPVNLRIHGTTFARGTLHRSGDRLVVRVEGVGTNGIY